MRWYMAMERNRLVGSITLLAGFVADPDPEQETESQVHREVVRLAS